MQGCISIDTEHRGKLREEANYPTSMPSRLQRRCVLNFLSASLGEKRLPKFLFKFLMDGYSWCRVCLRVLEAFLTASAYALSEALPYP